MRSIANFIREAIEELKKVVWPTREMIIRHTAIVIVVVVIAVLIISAIDLGLSKLLQLIINRA